MGKPNRRSIIMVEVFDKWGDIATEAWDFSH